MGKGSTRRPQQVPETEVAERWDLAFGKAMWPPRWDRIDDKWNTFDAATRARFTELRERYDRDPEEARRWATQVTIAAIRFDDEVTPCRS